MGINPQNQLLLEQYVFKNIYNFNVYELGDQITYDKDGRRRPTNEYYKAHGAASYTSFDVNGNSTHVLDLNLRHPTLPPPADLVTDFGTTEHVFNIGECWRTMHQLVKVGGFIVGEKITQGDTNHGFYNLQPTFITSFARTNGYDVVKLEQSHHIKSKRMRYALRKISAREFDWPIQDRYLEMLGGT